MLFSSVILNSLSHFSHSKTDEAEIVAITVIVRSYSANENESLSTRL